MSPHLELEYPFINPGTVNKQKMRGAFGGWIWTKLKVRGDLRKQKIAQTCKKHFLAKD